MLSVILLLSCKQETGSEKKKVTQPKTSQNLINDEDSAKADRIELSNKILKSLREPKLLKPKFKEKTNGEYPEKGIQASIWLPSMTPFEIDYKDEEVQKCNRELVDHLPEIFKNSKYSTVKEEIIRILAIIDLEETIKPLIEIASYSEELVTARADIVEVITTKLQKFGADNYANLVVPLIDDKEEFFVMSVLELFRTTKPESALEALDAKYKAMKWGDIQLNLLYTISEIDRSRKYELIDYIKEILRLLYTDRDGMRLGALVVIRKIKEPSLLEVLLRCFNNEKYKDREDFIFGMETYYDDPRVKDLFREILQSESYTIEYKMAVVQRFSKLRDSSVNKLILQIASDEMAIRKEHIPEHYLYVAECLSALKNNGDAETIVELQRLKKKYPDSAEDIDNAIEEIGKRIRD